MTGGDYLVAKPPSQTKTAGPDDLFSPSSPSGEPNIPGSISMVSPELKAAPNQSESKPLNLANLFAGVVYAQPHDQLTEQLTQHLGQINKHMNGGGGSFSSSSAAVAMDESAPVEDDKTGIKRRDKTTTGETPVKANATAKGMAKQMTPARTPNRLTEDSWLRNPG